MLSVDVNWDSINVATRVGNSAACVQPYKGVIGLRACHHKGDRGNQRPREVRSIGGVQEKSPWFGHTKAVFEIIMSVERNQNSGV
ncbi:MAG: hypothetical protein V3S94_03450, partial [Gammaproteobacteria bacterium]